MHNLVTSLAQQFGLKSEQIQAGAGAVLQLIQERTGSAEFQALVGKIPGAQAWIEQARALPAQAQIAGAGLLGQASSLLGAVTGQAQGGLGAVLGRLEQAGFKPDTAMQFVPALLDQIRTVAGPDTVQRILEAVPGLKDGAGGLVGKLLGR